MRKIFPLESRRTRSLMVAFVFGAALASMPAEKAQAAEPSEKAVNDISRYCQACWRNARLHPDSWSDCTQEVFTRLLESVEPTRWSTLLKKEAEDHREFLRAIDAVKKRNQRSRKYAVLGEDVTDHRGQPESARNELRQELDRVAQDVLGERQQKIVQLSCAGWSIPEIAKELRTTVARVSDEKYKAIRKLRNHLHDA
ncbi:MAG: sigma-70 family RNA polymerase sigma factor [Planctomycetes bacterium]|nr:sigma-70 family RNA polymerase sigma factor [Planctomycetota bacterium]